MFSQGIALVENEIEVQSVKRLWLKGKSGTGNQTGMHFEKENISINVTFCQTSEQ